MRMRNLLGGGHTGTSRLIGGVHMKNISIRGKLMLAAVPLVIASIIGMLLLAGEVNNALDESEKIFYEELYSINSLVNTADRDLYQARLAQERFMGAQAYAQDGTAVEGDYAGEFEENAQQTADGIAEIQAIVDKYPEIGQYELEGSNINTCLSDFAASYPAWRDMANPSTLVGEKYTESLELFSADILEHVHIEIMHDLFCLVIHLLALRREEYPGAPLVIRILFPPDQLFLFHLLKAPRKVRQRHVRQNRQICKRHALASAILVYLPKTVKKFILPHRETRHDTRDIHVHYILQHHKRPDLIRHQYIMPLMNALQELLSFELLFLFRCCI